MGLAEPRKRLKISHDPNNLTWAQSAESYGLKLLSAQGWKPGQGLGARSATHFNSPVPAVKITYKDDNLGLGAGLKSANTEHSRTGLDAFQGLLGRLNSRDEAEVKKLEQRAENRKLAMWTQGKWGGVIFVPGGLLVQGDKFKRPEGDGNVVQSPAEDEVVSSGQKAVQKEAKELRKKERRKRKEAKVKRRAERGATGSACDIESKAPKRIKEKAGDHSMCDKDKSSAEDTTAFVVENGLGTDRKRKETKSPKEKHQRQQTATVSTIKHLEDGKVVVDTIQLPTPPSESAEKPISAQGVQSSSRSGRHIIRGRNIQAKRMAFADAKLLDEIFMRKS